VLDALVRGDAAALSDACANALLAAAERVEPRLAEVRAAACDAFGAPVHLTGSGSALFVVEGGEATQDVAVPGVRSTLRTGSASAAG
jgi:4-diphosphocytidyl-2C-methyl-D-erythritol kinase